jgi:hypothetical protein
MTHGLKFALALFAFALIVPATASAKKKTEEELAREAAEEHKNHMQETDPVEEGDVEATLRDVHNGVDFAMVRVTVKNDGSDYVIFRKEEAVFHVAGQDLQQYDGKEKKPVIIEPRGKTKHTWKVKGEEMHVDEFSIDLKGFYLASADGVTHAAPDFDLEADNKFDAGPFDCRLKGLKKETKETQAGFDCTYEGKSIGFIDPSALRVTVTPEAKKEDRTPKTYANGARVAEPKMLQPGDKYSFKAFFTVEFRFADMQFSQMVIQWGDTFTESPIEEVDMGTVEFEIDEAKTREKNE